MRELRSQKGNNKSGLSFLGLVALFSGLVLVPAQAFSQTPSAAATELLVRYRAAQNTTDQSKELLTQILGADPVTGSGLDLQHVRLVNGEQGVVALKFKSAEEAARARLKLENSSDVESVSVNHLYRPAISISFKEVAPQSNATFLSVPFFPVNAARGGHHKPAPEAPSNPATPDMPSLPDVMLAPGQVTPGPDPRVGDDWAVKAVHLPMEKTASNITVAVIDTGVDYNHEDLVGGMWRSPNNPREVGYDFAHDNNKPYDQVHFDVQGCMKDAACAAGGETSKYLVNPGHGTHCAGHVGAVANNSLGIRGMGAGAGVMGLKFFYDYGEDKAGQGDDAAAIKAIDYAIKNGAKVISASWGGRMARSDADSSELKQALIRAQQAGVLVVVAAGNDGIDQESADQPDFPAAYTLDNLIVVAATDQDDSLASFSNYGATSVHIGAPGVKILSTIVGSKYSDSITTFTDSYGRERSVDWDGTSMATPIVAGAVALVWSQYPDADYHQIRDRILKSARPVPGLAGKVSTGGVLDIQAALSN